MPNVRIEMFEGRSQEQKNKLSVAITEAFVEHAKCKAEGVAIIFTDIKPSDWMTGGIPGTPAPTT
jgi:4-oxalocrotonate tautomerase